MVARTSITFILLSTIAYLLFFNLLSSYGASRGYRAKLKNLECYAHPEWLENASCRIRAVNRYKSVAEMYVAPLRPLRILYGEGKLYKRLSGWRPWVVQGNGSICEALGGKFHPLMNLFKYMLKKYTNINHTCPYSKPIIAHGLNLDNLNMGLSVFPEGVYRYDLYLFEANKTFIGFIKGYFEVDETRF